MTVKIVRGSSRLRHAELHVIDGIEFWSRPDIPELTPSNFDKQYIVEDMRRIDNVARDRYKREDWWWVLAHRNNYMLLPDDLVPGQRITVTGASQVRKELF